MTTEITKAKLVRTIKKMDPYLSRDDEAFDVAVVLLGSAYVGPNIRRLARLTGYRTDFVRGISQQMRKSGIWRGGRVHCEWMDEENGGAAFWLDVCCACGLIERVYAEAS